MKIVFTGGGTAGHVVPNIALIEELKNKHTLFYIGADGLEKQLLKPYIEDKTLSFCHRGAQAGAQHDAEKSAAAV